MSGVASSSRTTMRFHSRERRRSICRPNVEAQLRTRADEHGASAARAEGEARQLQRLLGRAPQGAPSKIESQVAAPWHGGPRLNGVGGSQHSWLSQSRRPLQIRNGIIDLIVTETLGCAAEDRVGANRVRNGAFNPEHVPIYR